MQAVYKDSGGVVYRDIKLANEGARQWAVLAGHKRAKVVLWYDQPIYFRLHVLLLLTLIINTYPETMINTHTVTIIPFVTLIVCDMGIVMIHNLYENKYTARAE